MLDLVAQTTVKADVTDAKPTSAVDSGGAGSKYKLSARFWPNATMVWSIVSRRYELS
jgi:hypothetical protein